MREAMEEALRGLGLTDYARAMKIGRAWREAVGQRVAARTVPQSYNRGTLVIRAASPAWQNELTFMKEQLIERLRATLPDIEVRELKVVSGYVPPEEDPTPVWLSEKPREEDLRAAAEATSEIRDPELAKLIAHAMELSTRAGRHRRG